MKRIVIALAAFGAAVFLGGSTTVAAGPIITNPPPRGGHAGPVHVTPAAPAWFQASCSDMPTQGRVVIPTVTGVSYSLDSIPAVSGISYLISVGQHYAGASPAGSQYVLDGTTSWTFTVVAATGCSAPAAAPAAPKPVVVTAPKKANVPSAVKPAAPVSQCH